MKSKEKKIVKKKRKKKLPTISGDRGQRTETISLSICGAQWWFPLYAMRRWMACFSVFSPSEKERYLKIKVDYRKKIKSKKWREKTREKKRKRGNVWMVKKWREKEK